MKTRMIRVEDQKPRRKSGSKGRRHYHPRTRYTVTRAWKGLYNTLIRITF